MKKNALVFITSLMLCLCMIASCKKGDTGPAGTAGVNGTNGTDGKDGNANVIQYTFGTQNLGSGFTTLQVTTTLDTMNNSTWLVYLYYQPLDRWYFVPGMGVGGSTQYRISMTYLSGKVNLYIDKTGPGETYAQAKVIRIYNTATLAGGRMGHSTPPVDIKDYEAVRSYYHLP